MPENDAPDQTALFRQSWTLYDALSERNYMFHREIFAEVARLLRESHAAGSYSMLDLGCGNARFLAPCLKTLPPASYDGVDLSATALEEARAHLRGLPQVALHEKDMLQALEDGCGPYDVIFSSFAVHHLSSADKARLFRACARRLRPGGRLILVDVVREEGQSRDEYLAGYLGMMREGWSEVPPEQLDEACAHVAAHDFPETLSELVRMAREAAFGGERVVARHLQHHVLAFSL